MALPPCQCYGSRCTSPSASRCGLPTADTIIQGTCLWVSRVRCALRVLHSYQASGHGPPAKPGPGACSRAPARAPKTCKHAGTHNEGDKPPTHGLSGMCTRRIKRTVRQRPKGAALHIHTSGQNMQKGRGGTQSATAPGVPGAKERGHSVGNGGSAKSWRVQRAGRVSVEGPRMELPLLKEPTGVDHVRTWTTAAHTRTQ